jgi:hypothetical protein
MSILARKSTQSFTVIRNRDRSRFELPDRVLQ